MNIMTLYAAVLLIIAGVHWAYHFQRSDLKSFRRRQKGVWYRVKVKTHLIDRIFWTQEKAENTSSTRLLEKEIYY